MSYPRRWVSRYQNDFLRVHQYCQCTTRNEDFCPIRQRRTSLIVMLQNNPRNFTQIRLKTKRQEIDFALFRPNSAEPATTRIPGVIQKKTIYPDNEKHFLLKSVKSGSEMEKEFYPGLCLYRRCSLNKCSILPLTDFRFDEKSVRHP